MRFYSLAPDNWRNLAPLLKKSDIFYGKPDRCHNILLETMSTFFFPLFFFLISIMREFQPIFCDNFPNDKLLGNKVFWISFRKFLREMYEKTVRLKKRVSLNDRTSAKNESENFLCIYYNSWTGIFLSGEKTLLL